MLNGAILFSVTLLGEMRHELQVESKLLLVTGGGGADAFPMMLECMKALKLLGPKPGLEAIFITGPVNANT